MKTTTETKKIDGDRNPHTGQYTYSSKFERLCRCGRILAAHLAAAPHPFDDLVLDPREDLPECEKFRLVRNPNPEIHAAAIAAYRTFDPSFGKDEE